jgi:hypothetical protein
MKFACPEIQNRSQNVPSPGGAEAGASLPWACELKDARMRKAKRNRKELPWLAASGTDVNDSTRVDGKFTNS